MADPRRLLDDPETSGIARDLLGSAADDGPSEHNRAAAARRLGIAAITLAGGGKATTAIAGALWWKAGLVVAVIGGIIGTAVVVGSSNLAGSAATDRAKLMAPVTPTVVVAPPAPVPEALEPAPVERAPVEPVPQAAVKPTRKIARPIEAPVEPAPAIEPPAPPVPAPTVPAPTVPAPIDARRLAAEVAVLDRARAALKGRDPAAALTVLDEHRREFAEGALVAEAEVVRLEALIQAGRKADARDQARSFLERFPSSPLVRRVRSLVERLEESP
ncbi:MAG: hypothetical protein WKG01_27650 [Kofleriaceae bacterium]